MKLLRDCHQIVAKTVEFFDRRSLGIEIRVRVAHRDADVGVPQEFFHRHNVHATIHETYMLDGKQYVSVLSGRIGHARLYTLALDANTALPQ